VEIIVPAFATAKPWVEGDSLDLQRPIAFAHDDLVDGDTCARLISLLEDKGFDDAPITTARGFVHNKDIRNNTRVMFDDHSLAAELWAQVEPLVPAELCRRRPVGLNERFRGYRYHPGQRFAPHYDGCFRRNADEESLLTFMLYLNEGMKGGATVFHHFAREVTPRTGRALFFQHTVLHEGAVIEEGVKYVLRSDVMYRRMSSG
jgi:prolyl 4-hydroxylase